ncbi:MAG: hypothetical protein QNK24_04195 [Desulfuromusa sp.]|nr:hypothetical protein [Desulfuromusa sp.]
MMVNTDYVLNVLEQTKEKEARFFVAWKRGVELVGGHLFGPKTTATAKIKDDLRPQHKLVEAELAKESCGEEQFLTSMVSFYSPSWGEELVEMIDCHKSFCGLTYNLDHERIEILCDLLRNFQGWPEPDGRI